MRGKQLRRQRHPKRFVKTMREESTSSFSILCDGELLPADSRVIPVSDGAVAFGAGVFETIAAYHGKLFAFDSHLDRLRSGMEALGISLTLPEDFEERALILLDENQLADASPARIRITVTAGSHTDHPHWIMEATHAPAHAAMASLMTGPFVRNEQSPLSGFKTINYGDNVIAMQRARVAGTTEALFVNTQGDLCEGTWSNVFFHHDGKWKTPPVSSGCLPGVTRACVLDLAENINLKIEEATLSLSKIGEIESAFLTSTMRGVQPVQTIDGNDLSFTRSEISALAKAYLEFAMR